jgi:hypothetical protein
MPGFSPVSLESGSDDLDAPRTRKIIEGRSGRKPQSIEILRQKWMSENPGSVDLN